MPIGARKMRPNLTAVGEARRALQQVSNILSPFEGVLSLDCVIFATGLRWASERAIVQVETIGDAT
jgi:hypothetical protein